MPQSLIGWLTPWEPLYWLIALFALAAYCYTCGLIRRRSARDIFPAIGFYIGLLSMYAVMQTHLDYYGHYVFFLHRLQHLVLHHMGPFLIALSLPSAVLATGAPRWLRHIFRYAADFTPLRWAYRFVQHPVVAGLVFVGLIAFWLTPSIHFVAMLSKPDYWIMNLSMAVDGLLFWWLILDHRRPGSTPVTYPIGLRVLVLWAVMPPQIAIGAYITLAPQTVYDVYAICGRAFPISPIMDQQIGGLITWIPAAMMSALATVILLHFTFRNEREAERAAAAQTPQPEASTT